MSDIAELMSRDPLSFTKDDPEFRAVVEKIRQARGQYNLGSQKAGKVKPPTTAKAKAVAAIGNLGLSGNLQSLLAGKKPGS
jgi:hypothetical protein